MLVGDGLTQIRIKTFMNLIQNQTYSSMKQNKAVETMSKALAQVITVPGDLHGGLFHFLNAIFSLFFTSLIQPVQKILGWKRLQGKDVSKCYQQAAGLATMISTELERNLLHKFVSCIDNDDKKNEVT